MKYLIHMPLFIARVSSDPASFPTTALGGGLGAALLVVLVIVVGIVLVR
jgi:hypothetical protein